MYNLYMINCDGFFSGEYIYCSFMGMSKNMEEYAKGCDVIASLLSILVVLKLEYFV